MGSGRRWAKAAGAILGTLMIPYIVTLFLWDHVDVLSQNEFYSGRTVILKETGKVVDAEEYLVMAVAAQMPASWPEEALKVQAIVARTALYQKMGEEQSVSEENLDFDTYDTGQMEKVWGRNQFEEYYNRIRLAVGITAGQVVLWEDTPIEALYHYASSGITRSDTTGHYPYLQSVDSHWDLQASGYLQSVTMTEDEFVQKIRLLEGAEQIGGENIASSIQVAQKDAGGYVEQILIEGRSFSGIRVAEVLGVTSCCFTIESWEEGIRVTALGIGHGYGLSQWGAKSMAEEGKKAEEILTYYYSGCSVKERKN